jgi:hypothetical protein
MTFLSKSFKPIFQQKQIFRNFSSGKLLLAKKIKKKVSDMSWAEYQKFLDKYIPEAQPGTKGYQQEGHVIPNFGIFKDKPEDLVIKAASEYPDWLQTVFLPLKSLTELETMKAKGEEMTEKDIKRLKKLQRKAQIKEDNLKKGQGIWD